MDRTSANDLREAVRQRYAQRALGVLDESSGCCSGASCDPITNGLCSLVEAESLPEDALKASLGCGNPTALATLEPGEVVLDLGSGGGIDVLLSAKRVGPTGYVYGLDMTDEMLELAERNKKAQGATNVSFLRGHIEEIPPEVLFVCIHDAGRSQMAAAFTRELSEGPVEVRSAGSTPASEINPAVVQAMREVGIDLSQEFPKAISDALVQAADVVVTMGCGDACPVYPGKRYEHWDLADPAHQPIESVRAIRDEIRVRVERLIGELAVATPR